MHPFLSSFTHIQYAFFWMFFGLAVAGNVLMVAAQYLIDLVSNIAGNVEKHMEKELHSPIHPPEGRAEEGVDDEDEEEEDFKHEMQTARVVRVLL